MSEENVSDCEDYDDDYPGMDDDEGDEDEVLTCSPSQCLFCELRQPHAEQIMKHVEEIHGLYLTPTFCDSSFEFYSFVKLINYFRKHKPSETEFRTTQSLEKLLSLDDSYMIPVELDDGLLQFDFESYQRKLRRLAPSTHEISVTIPAGEYENLKSAVAESSRLKKELEDLRERYNTDISQLRSSAQRFVASSPFVSEVGDSNLKSVTNGRNSSKVHGLNESEDDEYIGSYSHYSIHMDMLQDVVRTGSYRRAIADNTDMFKGKVVLDVGCGTGILSMFAAKAGASRVIGVDMSDIVYQAMDIVRENQLEEKITLIKGRIEEIKLPVEKVDIIISEWMGYFLLFESMLDSVIFARTKWLNNDGLVWPNRCDILLSASCDPTLRSKNITFWDDVYGFKMSCMKTEVCKEALVQVVAREHIVSTPTVIKTVDCCKDDIADLDFTSTFSLEVDRDCTIHALIGYFDTFFDSDKASQKVVFSTGAQATSTHWKQTVFLLAKPLDRIKGENISGSIDVRKLPKDPRSLQVKIKIDTVTYKYIIS